MGGSYRDLVAWPKGMALVQEIYRVTRGFPKDADILDHAAELGRVLDGLIASMR